MIITLIAVVIGGFLLAYVYIEHDRAEIQAKQEALQKEAEALKAKQDAEEKRRHDEFMKKDYEGGV
jgi:TRAP-type C4-dicarboxylate transport system permease small subunit